MSEPTKWPLTLQEAIELCESQLDKLRMSTEVAIVIEARDRELYAQALLRAERAEKLLLRLGYLPCDKCGEWAAVAMIPAHQCKEC
jgi:hypothetical protein